MTGERHPAAAGGHKGPSAPSAWVATHGPAIPRDLPATVGEAAVLDVACGSGRHVRLLRAQGLRVVAVDIDTGRLGAVADDPGVEVVPADLEGGPWPFAGRRFAGVVVTNYLWRPLLPTLVDAVAPGGLLIYETFAVGNERFGKPANPDHLLRPGELLEAVRGCLTVLAYRHGEVREPWPAVTQAICARREPDEVAA